MSSNMTAEELRQIVCDWPAEILDEVLVLFETNPDGWMLEGRYIPTKHAALLFEASGMRWLLSKCPEDEEMGLVNEGNVPNPIGIDIGGNNWYHGASLIHAISSAIKESK